MGHGTDNVSSTPSGAFLGDFLPPDLARWEAEVRRLLKGADFDKKMVTETLAGIRVSPLYTGADTEDLPWLESRPGQAPFVRGARAEGYLTTPWLVAQELLLPTCDEFNAALRGDLAKGQTAVNLVLDKAGQDRLDPDRAATGTIGLEGTSLASLADLEIGLAGIGLARLPLLIQAGPAALPTAALLLAHWNKQEIRLEALQGCLGFDPAAELARRGSLPLSLEQSYRELGILTRWALGCAPGVRTLPVVEDPWHEGGADSVLSLGLTLAAAVQQLRAMEQEGIAVEEAASRVQFHLSIGSDFFLEIAKIRALRLLWHDILAAAGCGEQAGLMTIHARTSRRTRTARDPHVNLLRVTTQAMSAVLGGVDSLHVGSFDEAAGRADDFSRRLARNLHLILARECHLDQVADPAGGSYYVESLTAGLARSAWKVFQEVERGGGVIAALQSGWIQKQIAAVADARAEKLAVRERILVGTNQYANPGELDRAIDVPDFAELHRSRSAQVLGVRPLEKGQHYTATLTLLETAWTSDPDRVLPLLAEAAVHGATLGELAASLGRASGSGPDSGPIAGPTVGAIGSRRDAEPFEILRRRVQGLSAGRPAAARVFFACLGDFACYMPRLEFTRRFFAVGGFQVLAERFFTEAEAAARAARESGAGTAILVGLDDTYGELAGPTVAALQGLEPPPRIMLAGRPAGLTEPLEQAGVEEFLHTRSNVLEVLARLAESLENGEAQP